jgi:hypothetical protein
MKQKVFLITGFQNWGKSYIIKKLFGQESFYKHKLYKLCDKEFCVQSQSNDDLAVDKYVEAIKSRIEKLGSNPEYIISAFRPTKEVNNDSINIINTLYKNADIYLMTIESKWCLHAKLNIDELKKYYSGISNLRIINISEKDPTKKVDNIKEEICKLI